MRRMKRLNGRARLRRRAWALLALCALLVALSAVAPLIAPNDPYATDPLRMNAAPGGRYPLGTDATGSCVLSRVLMGARTSTASATALVGAMFLIGTALGMLCGYYGGALDALVMRLADLMLSIPQMVLAIAVAGVLGGSLANAMIAIGVSGWTGFARLARGQVLSLKREPYILAARLSGDGGFKILFRHMLPNALGPLLVNAASQLGATMMAIAGLSFLGIGVAPPTAEWGSMINESRAYIQLAPWAVLAPAAAMVIAVMLFNLLGDTARDLLEVGE